MTGAARRGKITILAMRPWWDKGPPRKYVRLFAGLTVGTVVRKLNTNGKDPIPLLIAPFFVNGERVKRNSGRVLQAGDVLQANDP